MDYLVVGSEALRFWACSNRTPKDIDIIGTFDALENFIKNNKQVVQYKPNGKNKYILLEKSGKIIDWEIAWKDSSGHKLINIIRNDRKEISIFALPEVVLTLKHSHRFLKNSPYFLKTMEDIHFLKNKGYYIPNYLKDWLKIREEETYNYNHPKLNLTKNEFFVDNVPYVYDHDSIHEAVKIFDRPAYTYYKIDGQDVLCSKEKFYSVSEEIRVAGVVEETYTLALERALIPNDFKVDAKKVFLKALEKVCTSVTSGWFREYAWDNYYNIVNCYDERYVNKFHKALKENKIKRYKND